LFIGIRYSPIKIYLLLIPMVLKTYSLVAYEWMNTYARADEQ